jgi:hypothetical protein
MYQNGGNPLGNVANLVGRFNEFKHSFKGDPREEVQRLLNSGQMSQEQLNYLSTMAKQFQGILK